MRITKEQRDQISQYLPRGWRKKVAEKCNCSEVTVSLVLHGKLENILVAETIIMLAKNQKPEIDAKKAQLQREVDSLGK